MDYPDLREFLGLSSTATSLDGGDGSSVSISVECNATCDRFEAALRRGDRPRIETILAAAPDSDKPIWLRELLHIELEYLQEVGERIRPSDYTSRFPESFALIEQTFLNPEIVSPPQLANYRILEQIGSGGMGVVYLGQHNWTDQLVAIKLLSDQWRSHPLLVERFLQELRLLGKLQHENIVRIYDGGKVGKTYYLAMEYLRGPDFQTLVDEQGVLSVGSACEVIRQAACGLQSLYENKLVHRDIKPGNLILEENSAVVKLLDLGLARGVRGSQRTRTAALTQPGAVLGTPEYMAPEQWDSPADTGIQADIYSLGCTLYFLLSGRTLYRASGDSRERQQELHRLAHQADELPSLPEQEGIPTELNAVFQKMIARNTEDRFAQPSQVMAAIRPWANPESLFKLCRQHRSQTLDISPDAATEPGPGAVTHYTHSTAEYLATPSQLQGTTQVSSAVKTPENTLVNVANSAESNLTDSSKGPHAWVGVTRRLWFQMSTVAIVTGIYGVWRYQSSKAKRLEDLLNSPILEAERRRRLRFADNWATLPGPDGTWWFDEMPWMLPFVRTAMFQRMCERVSTLSQKIVQSKTSDFSSKSVVVDDAEPTLGELDPDTLFDLRDRTLREVSILLDRKRSFSPAQRTLVEAILEMNRTRTTLETVLDESVADTFIQLLDQFEKTCDESSISASSSEASASGNTREMSAEDLYTCALFRHKIATVYSDSESMEKVRAAYEAVVTNYRQKCEVESEPVQRGWLTGMLRRALIDYGRFTISSLQDYAGGVRLLGQASELEAEWLKVVGMKPLLQTTTTHLSEKSNEIDSSTSLALNTATVSANTDPSSNVLVDLSQLEGLIVRAVAAPGAKNMANASRKSENGTEGGLVVSSLDRYSESIACFRRITRQIEGTLQGRISTGILAQSYEREAWTKMAFWMINQAKKDFEKAKSLRETVRFIQQNTPLDSRSEFSEQEPFLFHNRHGIAMTERYLGNLNKAYDDYGTLLEDMWRRYWEIQQLVPKTESEAAASADTNSSIPMLIDETRDFFERFSNSSERRGDMVLYQPFTMDDASLRGARYVAAGGLYDDAVRYAVDPKARRIMQCKLTLLHTLYALDDPLIQPQAVAEVNELNVLASEVPPTPSVSTGAAKTPVSEGDSPQESAADGGPVESEPVTSESVQSDQTKESKSAADGESSAMIERDGKDETVTAKEYTLGGWLPVTQESLGSSYWRADMLRAASMAVLELWQNRSSDRLRMLIHDFWKQTGDETADKRERLEILLLMGELLLRWSMGYFPTYSKCDWAHLSDDLQSVHRDVISVFRGEFRQLVDPTEMLPWLRRWYDLMLLTSRILQTPPQNATITTEAETASTKPTEVTGNAVERLRQQIHSEDAPETKDVPAATDSQNLIRQMAELILESRQQTRNGSRDTVLFYFAPDSLFAPSSTANTSETVPVATPSARSVASETADAPSSIAQNRNGLAIRWPTATDQALVLLPLDFDRRDVLRNKTPIGQTSQTWKTVQEWLASNPEIFWDDSVCWGSCTAARQAITMRHWHYHFEKSES